MSTNFSNDHDSQSIDADHLFTDDSSSVYDRDLNSNEASIDGSSNAKKRYILRKRGFVRSKTSSAPCSQPITENTLREPDQPSPHRYGTEDVRRHGKVDWHPHICASFSLSGQQYGLGGHHRGYLSGTFVTQLTYPGSIAPAPSRRRTRLRRRLCVWRRHGST